MKEAPAFYNHPPVIERVASLYVPMEEELFAMRMNSWEQKVKEAYPITSSFQNWILRAEHNDEGAPLFDTLHPLLQIIPRYSRKSEEDGYDWSIRCPNGQFTMNMHSDPGVEELRRFKHLREEFAIWMPHWIDHFDVKKADRLTLHYFNALTPITVPKFYEKGRMRLSDIISGFANIPGEQDSIIAPYSSDVNVMLLGDREATLRIKINDLTSSPFGSGVEVSFVVTMPFLPKEVISFPHVLELLDKAHEYIVARFEAVFTTEAKESFQPESQ